MVSAQSYDHEEVQPLQQAVVVGGVRPSSSLSTGASYVDSYFLDPAQSPSPHNINTNNNQQQHNYSHEQQQQQPQQPPPYLPTPTLPPQDPTPAAPTEAPPASTEASASAEASGAVVQGSSDFVTSAARGLSLLSQFGRPSEGGGPASAGASATATGGAASPPPPLLPPVADYLPTSVYPVSEASLGRPHTALPVGLLIDGCVCVLVGMCVG